MLNLICLRSPFSPSLLSAASFVHPWSLLHACSSFVVWLLLRMTHLFLCPFGPFFPWRIPRLSCFKLFYMAFLCPCLSFSLLVFLVVVWESEMAWTGPFTVILEIALTNKQSITIFWPHGQGLSADELFDGHEIEGHSNMSLVWYWIFVRNITRCLQESQWS